MPADTSTKLMLLPPDGTAGTDIVPQGGWRLHLELIIYVPFHKSEAEMDSMVTMFKFWTDNYDEIRSYMHKYINQYARTPSDRNFPVLKESILDGILHTKLFLSAINKELGLYTNENE